MLISRRQPLLASLSALALTTLLGCGTDPSSSDGGGRPDREPAPAHEVAGPQPRLAVGHDDGIQVLDASDGTVLADVPQEGFVRLSPAGDQRHVMVASAGGFRALDLASWTDAHGDHGHSFAGPPRLTGTTFAAEEPGHVVSHAGRTVLFDDGTGTITSFDPDDLVGSPPDTRTRRTPAAHHGVAVELADGSVVHTVGDSDARSGIEVRDDDGTVLARSSDCPGVHGEAFAGRTAVFGCEDGVLVVDGDRIRKVDSPDPYGRIGNQAGSPHSPVLLGDYKVDAEAELERPTRISLVDTRRGRMRLVDLETSYSFRSLGRGPDGEALVLGTDGRLHVIDPGTGERARSLDVTSPWREPLDWQQPRPSLVVVGDTAWVSEPASRELHAVDMRTWKIRDTLSIDVVPNEFTGVVG